MKIKTFGNLKTRVSKEILKIFYYLKTKNKTKKSHLPSVPLVFFLSLIKYVVCSTII